MKKLKNSKGFTLMEMLIVVAIIAILVAIAIPTFTNQLEKARESADLANLRSAYAEVIAAALTDADTTTTVTKAGDVGARTWTKTVPATKTKDTWVITDATKIGDVDRPATPVLKGKNYTVQYSEATQVVTIAAAS